MAASEFFGTEKLVLLEATILTIESASTWVQKSDRNTARILQSRLLILFLMVSKFVDNDECIIADFYMQLE
jgi:hypothetical protein